MPYCERCKGPIEITYPHGLLKCCCNVEVSKPKPDIVDRLKNGGCDTKFQLHIMEEAAKEIERLRAQIQNMRDNPPFFYNMCHAQTEANK